MQDKRHILTYKINPTNHTTMLLCGNTCSGCFIPYLNTRSANELHALPEPYILVAHDTSASLDSDKPKDHKVLRSYLYSSIVLGLSYCLFFWYFEAWLNLLAPTIFTIMVFISIVLERHHQVWLASFLLVISLWLAPAWCIIVSGALYSPLLIWLTPTILMSAVLLGSRWAIFIGTMSFSVIIAMFYFNASLAPLSEFHPDDGLNTFFLLSGTSAVILIAFYGYIFTRELQKKSDEIVRSRDEIIKTDKEKIEVYVTMLSATNHILNNFLQKMLYFKLLAEKQHDLDPEAINFYDRTIQETSEQIKNLDNIQEPSKEAIKERYLPK